MQNGRSERCYRIEAIASQSLELKLGGSKKQGSFLKAKEGSSDSLWDA